jgi:hypothetical protein
MNRVRRITILGIAAVLAVATIELGTSVEIPGFQGFAPVAHARVGRPLTPVSVAGVGRRTVRRCAVGAYNC